MTPFRFADVATVTLLVGEAKAVFNVHEAVLFEASPVFKAAFASKFREGPERIMVLPEDDKTVFELFVGWLYNRRYHISAFDGYEEYLPEDFDNILMLPIQLFMLADKYQVPDLKSLVLGQMFKFLSLDTDYGPSLYVVAYAYEHTSPNAAIRKILTDYLVWSHDFHWYKEAYMRKWLENHPDISVDLNFRFAKYVGTQRQYNPFNGEMPKEYLDEEQECKEEQKSDEE